MLRTKSGSGSVAGRGWIAVTRDRNIRYRTHEMNSIRDSAARVIVIRMKAATGEAIAEVRCRSMPRIARFVAATPAPFVVALTSNGALRQIWPPDEDDARGEQVSGPVPRTTAMRELVSRVSTQARTPNRRLEMAASTSEARARRRATYQDVLDAPAHQAATEICTA